MMYALECILRVMWSAFSRNVGRLKHMQSSQLNFFEISNTTWYLHVLSWEKKAKGLKEVIDASMKHSAYNHWRPLTSQSPENGQIGYSGSRGKQIACLQSHKPVR